MRKATIQEKTHKGPWQSFWFHILLILLVCIALYLLFFSSLGWITNHGNDATVPKLKGQKLAAAMSRLEAAGFEVIVDSVYEPEQQPLIVTRQSPDPGDLVKQGRTIFLTVTKVVPPTTPMPNILNLSLRSAVLILKNSRLELGDTTFRPDIAKGAILEMALGETVVRPGQLVPQGSRINLVIGAGLGDTEMSVPDVTGMSYPEAVAVLSGSGLQYVPVWEGLITDSSTAIVYMQTPEAYTEMGSTSKIRQGDFIDLHIMQEAGDIMIDSIKKSHRYVPRGDQNQQHPDESLQPGKQVAPTPASVIEAGKNAPARPSTTPMGPPKPGGQPIQRPAAPQKETPKNTNPQRPY